MARQAKRRTQTETSATFRAVAYYRVSSQDQADSHLGLDAQATRCQGVATAKGWELVNTYADEGISGGKPPSKRPGLASLLDDTRAGKVDAVIVAAVDRLARDAEFALAFERELTQRGVALLSCRETFDTSTAAGKLSFTVTCAIGEYERNVGAERTKAALGELGKTTGDKGGKMPYGYCRVGEAGAVEVDEARANGDTLRQIADALNADQVAPPGRGRQWHASSVMDVLDNADAYQGGPRADSPARWPVILN